jgi:membrane fusion protein (multidrug efflux system)
MKIAVFFTVLALGAVAQAEAVPGIVKPYKSVTIQPPVLQETITEMRADEGQEVRKGDLLVQLRNDREKLDVQLSEKLIELKRFIAQGQDKLFKEKMGSEEKALEAKTELEIAEVTLQAKKVALDEKTIRAPMDGVVVKRYKETGEAVDRTEKLLDLINYDQVFVEFFVKPELRRVLKTGDGVKVKVMDLDGADFAGKIDFIDPRNEAGSGFIRVKVLMENPEHRIKPGMKSTAEFGK